MERRFKRVTCIILLIISVCLNADMDEVHAAGYQICGVDIGYQAGAYFTDNGKACTDHGTSGIHSYYNEAACNCICTHNGESLGAVQCFGFARYVQNKLFGSNSYSNANGFYKISGSSVAAGSLTTTKLKQIVSTAKPGAHIRTNGSAHSMIITNITDSGFSIIQCNGSNNKEYSGHYACRIGTYTYTWQSYVSSTYGQRGINYVEMPKNYTLTTTKPFLTCVDYPTENETYTGNVYMQGWALYGEGISEVVCYVNDQPMCNCERYGRTSVANTYPGYPTGKEGFKCTIDSSVFKEGANAIFFRAYTNNNSVILGDFGHRTINYVKTTDAGEQTISDGEYRIVSALDMSKALDIAGASTEDGANVQLWGNRSDPNQTFYITYLGNGYYKIISKCSGKSLDVEDGNTQPGTNVQQYTWNGTNAQQWVIKPDSGGVWFHIISKSNNLYLDAQNEQSHDGANVHVYSETGSPAQKWRLLKCGDDVGQTVEDGEYHIVSALDNSKTVNVAGNSTDAGANIRLWETLDEPRQKFKVNYLGNGYYSIINTNSGLAMSMKDSQATSGTNVQQEIFTSGQRQYWIIKDAGNGYYYIISQLSGLYLDVYAAENVNGANIQVWVGNGTAAQKWKFVKNIKEATVSLGTSSYTYDGIAKKPTVTVKHGNTILTQGTDYTVSYSNNVNVGTATVTITGKGVYVGTITKTFRIEKASQNISATITATTINEGATAQITASGQGTVSYSSSNSAVAMVNSDGLVTGKSEGTATITVRASGNSNYNEGSKTITVTISKAITSLTDATVELSATMYTYDGAAKKPTVTVKQGNSILTEGTDYIVSYSNNVNAGTALITVMGKGNYTGTVTKNYSIEKANQTVNAVISTSAIKEGQTTQITSNGQGTISYSSSNTAVATVDSSGVVTGKSEGVVTITVRASGNSNFNIGSKTITVTVSKSAISLSGAVIDMETTSYTYDGTAKKPVMIVKVDNVTLTEGTDYITAYSNNVNVGTAKITITGKGLYEGTKEKSFSITKATQTVTANISASTIKIGETASITAGGYGTISYSSSSTDVATIDDYGIITGLSEGTSFITVRAEGDTNHYSASELLKIVVTDTTIDISETYISTDKWTHYYTGTEVEPVVTVEYQDTVLIENVDYTISYDNNIEVGTASITVIGKGSYTGVKTETFRIVKASQNMSAQSSKEVISCGETAQIITNGHGDISYETFTTSIVTVDSNGVVTGLSEGTATIFVEATGNNNYYADFTTVHITVVNEEEKESDSMDDQISTDVENDRESNAENDAEIETDEESDTEISSIQLQQVGTKLADSNGNMQYTVTSSDVSNPTVSFDGAVDENAGEIMIPEYIEYNGIEYEVTTVSIKSFEESNAKYRVVSNHVDNLTVEYIGTINKKSKTISIPKSVTYKGIKFKVTSIKAKALKNNRKVTNVKVADSIQKIGDSAFEGCANLKTVTIGKELQAIGKYVFKNCKKLKKITIKSSHLKNVGKNALKGIGEECEIKVPKKKILSYQRIFKGKGQKKSVQITK